MKKIVLLYFAAALGTVDASDHWWRIHIGAVQAEYRRRIIESVDRDSIRTTEEHVLVYKCSGSRFQLVKLDRRPAVVVSSPGKARRISREGESLWVLTVEGKDTDRIVGGWTWSSQE
jgi:hypothetical protein